MRSVEKWNEGIYLKYMDGLPPRIQQDLQTIKFSTPVPKLGSYFLSGIVNTGKTILAARLYMQAMQQKYLSCGPQTNLFITVPALLAEIKKTYDHPELFTDELVAKYSTAEFLVLDDLGVEQSTEWVLSTLYLIINNRYDNMLTTVITSNYNLDELTEKLGDARIPSRIDRMCKLIKCKGWR